MLGADGPRVYLLLFDNNAEIRATGGLPGQFAEIRADAGQLTMIKQGTATDIKASPQPLLTQSVAEKQVYGERMAEAFQDTNVTPEFPRTAELVRGMWSRFAGGEQLDGVWSLDTVSISYLLGATGPVKAPDGTELTKYNSTEALLHGIYVRTPDKGEQDEFFSGFAKNLFDKIVAGHAPPLALASALSASTIEGRTHVYDFHPEVRRQLAGTPLAGELPTGGRHPQVGVYLDNAVPSKLSYYLRTKVSVTARSCDSARQQLSGTARLTYSDQGFAADALNTSITGHGAPGTPIGEQRVLARLYGPAGGSITDVRVDGNTVLAEPVTDRGRPIVTVPVQLAPGHSVPVTWKMSSGKRQDRDPELSVTPGFDHVPALRVTPTRCHAD
jgi:hypothetical protein